MATGAPRAPGAPGADLSLPKIALELLEDLSPDSPRGFLRLVRRRYRAVYPDGTRSDPFVYDAVDRAAIDAVVIVAHFVASDGSRRVYLRSAVRPPLALREPGRSPLPNDPCHTGLWEVPAGLVEVSEQSATGVARSAQRELAEELGFSMPLAAMKPLGASAFPCPGVIAERHFFFEVSVTPSERQEPELDGSALEHLGAVVDVSLEEALDMCRCGQIEDSKTELALWRLLDALRLREEARA
ncbi:MAG: NUDIX domain-containing protein [Pseudomonadota bacterium]